MVPPSTFLQILPAQAVLSPVLGTEAEIRLPATELRMPQEMDLRLLLEKPSGVTCRLFRSQQRAKLCILMFLNDYTSLSETNNRRKFHKSVKYMQLNLKL